MLQTVKEARKLLGLTQEEMAKKLGITRNYLALMETGKRSTPAVVVTKANELVSCIHADHATNNGGTQAIGNGISVGGEAACAESLARIEAKLDALALDMAIVKRLLAK